MADIDIERRWVCHDGVFAPIFGQPQSCAFTGGAHGPDCGWRLLVALADEGGELWQEKRPCEHGVRFQHSFTCRGVSRVRVWPKALTEGKN